MKKKNADRAASHFLFACAMMTRAREIFTWRKCLFHKSAGDKSPLAISEQVELKKSRPISSKSFCDLNCQTIFTFSKTLNVLLMCTPKSAGYCCLFLVTLVLFTSCLTPRKIDKWTAAHYGATLNPKIKNNDYITIKASNTGDIASVSEKRKFKLLPALFYWKWEYGTNTRINQALPTGYFNTAVLPYANTRKLKEKLNGQKLELTINNVPVVFSVVDKGWMVFLVLGHVGNEHIYIDPEKQDMVIGYRLLKDNVETRKGTITVANRNKAVEVKVFHSTKKTYWDCLDQYTSNIQAMSKEAIDKLITDITSEAKP